MSEKLDGVRAWWTGTQFLSRLGNIYHAPDWFIAGLPNVPLDGELWLDRKAFQRTGEHCPPPGQERPLAGDQVCVFDAPGAGGPFEERQKALAEMLRQQRPQYAKVLEQVRCTGLDALKTNLPASNRWAAKV